ncbi:hypothetical protein Tco_1278292, partial [Tanacetum coccineum]
KDCRSKQGNIARSTVYQELDLDDNWDIVSADFDDSSVYSILEGEEEDDESDNEQEEEDNQFSHHAFMFHPGSPTKITKSVGFAKTSDYKGGLAVQVNAVIKQNNTLLYLATKQIQKLVELEEKSDKLKQEIEKEVQPADLEDSISSLSKRLDSFSISGKLPICYTDHGLILGHVRIPSRVAVNERLNRSVSLRFERYRQTPQPPRYSVDQHDREVIRNDNLDEDEEHFIGICLQTPQEEHISYDVCFCENCLNEARILEEEPLNKVRRFYKPNSSMQWSWESCNWLGADEFSDDEVTPGKVTILEERSDWDDDERSGGKVLVIQERLAQNQQEFLDEYLPQWDEHLAIQKQELESEWENPFAAKRGENHTILHLSKEEENDDLPYPKPDYHFGYPQGKSKIFSAGYGEYYNSQWTLPPAWIESGVMLVLPADLGLWVGNLATKSEDYIFLQQKSFLPKLPPSLSKKIEESFRTKHPGLNSGFLHAIKFTHTFVSEMCKDAALAKELRDLSLCSAIPIPGYYKNNRKKKEGHFAKDCRSKQGNIARSAVYQELDLDDNWDIVSADFDDSSVYSISEGEGDTHQNISVMVQDTPIEETVFMAIKEDDEIDSEEEDNQSSHYVFMFHPGPPTKIAELVQAVRSWKPNKELPAKIKNVSMNGRKTRLPTIPSAITVGY